MEEIDGKKTGKIINWLEDKDMLPSQIPNARTIAFNYNSDWVTKGTKIELWDLGTELMRELDYERTHVSGWNDPNGAILAPFANLIQSEPE